MLSYKVTQTGTGNTIVSPVTVAGTTDRPVFSADVAVLTGGQFVTIYQYAGSAPMQKTQLNIHELCEHVYHLLRGEAPSGVVIDRDYDPSLPPVERCEIQPRKRIRRIDLQIVETELRGLE